MNAVFVDHKLANFVGLNRTHCKQAKRVGADKSELEPYAYELHNPHIMGYYACHRSGTSCYRHAFKRKKKRGVGNTVDIWKITSEDVIEAFEYNFIPLARIVEADYFICDGVKIQHAQEVRDMCEEHEIRIHPSACKPHNIVNGYPPYSHCFMPLDHRAFAPYQQELSALCKAAYPQYANDNNDDGKLCFLFDNMVGVWDRLKYMNICAETIINYGDICEEVIEREGDIKGMK